MNNKTLKDLLAELDEQAQELIDLGDSKEKAEGHGMRTVTRAISDIMIEPTQAERITELPSAMNIEDVPKGEWFKRKPDAKKCYIKDGYCRYERKYEATHEDDHCKQVYLKKGTVVYIEK